MKKVLIGGIGNVLLGDDSIGPYVARLLDSIYKFDDGVEVADLGTPALDLIDQFSGKDAVILIDSVEAAAAPGTVLLYRKADFIRHCPSVRMDPHSPALVESFLTADLLGVGPADVLLVGIKGESFHPGGKLSAPVSAALDAAVVEVLHELDRLGVRYEWRKRPLDPDIWWLAEEDVEIPPNVA